MERLAIEPAGVSAAMAASIFAITPDV